MLTLTGLDAVILRLQALKTKLPEAAGGALHDAVTEVVFPVTQARVPLDTGDLMATGRVSPPVRDGATVRVTLSYGNPNDATGEYAVEQHENLTYHHAPGRSAKYVEGPAMETAQAVKARVAALTKERLR